MAEWLTSHRSTKEASVTYMAIRVRTSPHGEWIYEQSFGDRHDWPRTQPQYLIAHAILDLTRESRRRPGA